jgi:hypothetical protein
VIEPNDPSGTLRSLPRIAPRPLSGNRPGITDPRERPEAPDRIVVDRAFQALLSLGLVNRGARLHIGPRIQRAVSTLFLLRWKNVHGGTTSAYYKVLRPPRDVPTWWTQETRAYLHRASLLDQRLASLGDDGMVRAARLLAVDPDTSTIVALAMPGTPLTDHLRKAWRTGRRSALEDVYFGLGRFSRRIENCMLPDEVPPVGARPAILLERLRQVQTILSDDLTSVEWLLERLFEEAASADRLVVSHSDLNPKNILIDGKDVGVIDFGWIPRFPGHDVAFLACRSKYVLQVPTPWVGGLTDALVAGYGEPGMSSKPQWKAAKVEALLRVIVQQRNQTGLHRIRYWRAVKELRWEAR